LQSLELKLLAQTLKNLEKLRKKENEKES